MRASQRYFWLRVLGSSTSPCLYVLLMCLAYVSCLYVLLICKVFLAAGAGDLYLASSISRFIMRMRWLQRPRGSKP